MWRTKKDALLLFVSFSFYLVFFFDALYGENSLDVPQWVHIVCPVLIIFLGLGYVQELRTWREWLGLIDVHHLTMGKNIGFLVDIIGLYWFSLGFYMFCEGFIVFLKEILVF